jgi:hypothetical protein
MKMRFPASRVPYLTHTAILSGPLSTETRAQAHGLDGRRLGQKAKQPYAIAMKDGSPSGLDGIWENWKDPASGEWVRTFAIITTDGQRDCGRNPRPHAPDHCIR